MAAATRLPSKASRAAAHNYNRTKSLFGTTSAHDRRGLRVGAIDLVLAEFQELLGRGDVIAEAEDHPAEVHEIVRLVEWSRPRHVVIVVGYVRQEERLVTVYEPDPSLWSADYRRRR
jgi:hypothetical protein